jgi:hypothetical protein
VTLGSRRGQALSEIRRRRKRLGVGRNGRITSSDTGNTKGRYATIPLKRSNENRNHTRPRPGRDPAMAMRPASSTTQITVIFWETSNPTKQVIYEPPTVRITGRHRPDRGTIGGSRADRDYRMSRHDNAALTLVAPPRIADRRPLLATRPGFRSHYEIHLTAFYLSPKRCRHRRHRPRRRSPGDCMLSSRAPLFYFPCEPRACP